MGANPLGSLPERIGELHFKADNTIAGDDSQMAVDLKFNSIDDFDPAKIVDQIEPLKKLLASRNKLNDLMSKIDRSEELEGVLERVLQNADDLKKISEELGVEAGDDSGEGGES